ncbi:Lateral flagellin [Photobacterium makurazakiensis]|uniref:flagellin N-terminal helical domain-containing protein n=1 Tax=Photobacterium makurazakiensis TaxID=2910234 RepID=UPI003D0BDD47
MLSMHTNYTSLLTQNNLNKTSGAMDQAMQRISTGFRINNASDDAAGLQIATRLQSQVNGLGVASRNSQDAISMLQTAEGAFDEMTNIGHRMKDLATQAANGTNSENEHDAMQAEWSQLVNELESVIENTQYGSGNNLFAAGGLLDKDITFQIGATTDETLTINIASSLEDVRTTIGDLKGLDLGAPATGDLDGYTNADDAHADGWEATFEQATASGFQGDANDWDDLITAGGAPFEAANKAAFDVALAEVQEPSGAAQAMDAVDRLLNGGTITMDDPANPGTDIDVDVIGMGAIRSELGANINRLDHTIANLGNMQENTEMAKGRIMDTDYAVESSNMMKNQMLTQMSMSMLSQANGMSGMVMSLVG